MTINVTRVDRTAAETRGRGLVVLIAGLPVALISYLLLAIDLGDDFLMFGIMAIVFLSLAGVFIVSNGSLNAQWCTAPSFMTLLAALQFVAVPFLRFIIGEDHIDAYYLRAMALLLLGYGVFWAVCLFLKKPYRFAFEPEFGDNVPRIHFVAIALFVVGTIANMVTWKLGILSYGASDVKSATGTSNVAALVEVGRLLIVSMLISGIEVLGKHSRSAAMHVILGASFLLSLAFGLISGLKIAVLMPVFALALVVGITRRRLPRLLLVLPILFALLQQFVNSYRANLNAGYGAQINTVSGLTSAIGKSVQDAISGNRTEVQYQSELDRFGSRLSELALFHSVLQLPSPDLLNGDETIWLAPVYPLIPRPLWKGKPSFNKGQRMSEALGYGINNSVNVPGVADLYVLGGTGGIVVGMLLWGLVLQLYMNNIDTGLTERGTLIYVALLFALTDIERDIVAMIGGAVEGALITLILSKIVYGGPIFSMRARPRQEATVTSS